MKVEVEGEETTILKRNHPKLVCVDVHFNNSISFISLLPRIHFSVIFIPQQFIFQFISLFKQQDQPEIKEGVVEVDGTNHQILLQTINNPHNPNLTNQL